MLNHVMIGSNSIEKTKSFYNAVLGVLGASAPMEHVNDTGQTRLFYIHDGSTFSVSEPINGEPVSVANGSTIGFVCNAPEQVKEFHDVACVVRAHAQVGILEERFPFQRCGLHGLVKRQQARSSLAVAEPAVGKPVE